MQQSRMCQLCHKKEATWHITDIVNGESRELHICEECAQEKSKAPKSVATFLAELVKSSAKQIGQMAKLLCPRCGSSYLDFHTNRRLGCPYDYQAFGESMKALLEKIHGETRHLGKVPAGADGRAARQAELRRLHQTLRRAVDQEHYEEAALLRDRIQQMEGARGGAQ